MKAQKWRVFQETAGNTDLRPRPTAHGTQHVHKSQFSPKKQAHKHTYTEADEREEHDDPEQGVGTGIGADPDAAHQDGDVA